MQSALIFGNGEIKDYAKIKTSLRGVHATKQSLTKSKNLIICADGGARHALNLNLIPDAIIGDMDSITVWDQKQLLKIPHLKWVHYPKEKDRTDSQLAIEYAVRQQSDCLILLGFFGSRSDHFLSTLFYLATLDVQLIEILSEKETLHIMRNKFVLKGKKGQLFSIIPLFENIEHLTLTGARYELKNQTLRIGSTTGVSNVMRSDQVIISYDSDQPLLVVQQV